jgi:Zn-dependent membrane protease YugP
MLAFMGFYIDPLYILFVAPGFILAMLASWVTKSTFNKYSKYTSSNGMTGAQSAKLMLERNGVYDCTIEPVSGYLSDHYDPSSKTLRLSEKVYSSNSLSAIGVACHEAGHALQHANNYAFLTFRSMLVPVVNFSSSLSYFFIFAGLIFRPLLIVGCVLFAVGVFFAIITLPVEWDASERAKKAMVVAGMVTPQESRHCAKVLNAAFLTYLASAVSAIMVLLYYLYRAGVFNRRG